MAKRARRNGNGKERRRAPPPPPALAGPNWRTLAIVIVIFLLVAVSVYAITTQPADKDGDGNGDGNGTNPPPTQAPGFSLTTLDGEAVSLDRFRGSVVVLDLMATWCNPCKLQMEELNQLRATYPERQVVILSVGVDTSESAQQLQDFKDQHYASWRFARDTDDVGTKYDAQSIPTLAIIDKDGNLEWRHAGVTTFEDLRDMIEPLL